MPDAANLSSIRTFGGPLGRFIEDQRIVKENRMMKLKLLVAAAALATLMAGPATARVYHHHGAHYYHHGYYNPGPIGAAAGIAGAAIGTAGAIATAPFRGSYAYGPGYYGRDPYYGRGW